MRFFVWNFRRTFAIISAVIMIAVTTLCGAYFIQRKVVYPLKFKEEVFAAAAEYGVDAALVYSVIKVESDFNARSISSKGAYGLMQITEKTADYIARLKGVTEFNILDPKTNIDFGSFYLKYLIDKFVNLQTAVYAYNAGEGNVSVWLKNKEYSIDGKTLKTVPFQETRDYWQKIQKTFSKYKKLYRNILDK